MKAEILSVGNEILGGHTVNTDASELSRLMGELGISVVAHTVVGDDSTALRAAVEVAKGRAELIVTTGGLGPTYDDLTKETLSAAFGLPLERNENEEAHIRAYFERSSTCAFAESNLKQADLPRGSTVLHNDYGTAPGCLFESGGKTVVMLPGPPRECIPLFRNRAMPLLRGKSGQALRCRELHVMGIGESAMAERLSDLMEGIRNPVVAPYTRTGECMVRLTATAETAEECELMLIPVEREIRERLGEYIYGTDGATLEATVLSLLRQRSMTLAAAESCTGGLVAKRLTDIPGASDCFVGGMTTYTEEAKCRTLDIKQSFIDRHGVVSAAVADKMARRVRKKLRSDLGIGITGWAGPGGEDVGLVYVALAWKNAEGKTMSCVRRLTAGDTGRDRVRTVAANNALDMARRFLSGMEV